MSLAASRVSGAWVDNPSLKGAARVAGAWVDFGPAGGTVDEWLQMGTPLSSTDWSDSNTNVGVRFAVTTAGSWVGNRVWRPATAQAGGVESVWGTNDDSQTIIAPVTALASASLDQYVDQMFSSPAAVVPGVNYVAAYHTDRYGFSRVTDGATVPFSSQTGKIYTGSSGMAEVAVFRFGSAGDGTLFTPSANFHYNVSPIVRFSA